MLQYLEKEIFLAFLLILVTNDIWDYISTQLKKHRIYKNSFVISAFFWSIFISIENFYVVEKSIDSEIRIGCWNMMNKVFVFDTKYMSYSYIVYTVKMESVYKIRIFGLKMKSGLEFFFWNPFMRDAVFFCYWIYNFG
jgi:hypothetical protein